MSAATATAGGARGRRRGRRVVVVLVVLVLVLAVLAVVAELVLRHVVDRTIADRIESSLPSGTAGHVVADAHGVVIPQLVAGRLDDVDVTTHDLTVRGVPLALDATVHDVPVRGTGRTGRADGTVRLTASAVRQAGVLDQVAGDVRLRDGGVAYAGRTRFLGTDIRYQVTAAVAAAASGRGVTITPHQVRVTNSALGIDVGGRIPGVSGTPVDVCTARYLPAALRLRSIAITASAATIRIDAAHVPLSDDALRTTGSCS
ncbi:hypothetical protein DEI93_09290 [Curtobacterium sp. MCBD17_035]|uniref:hypothetical protein n=1 Tax=Curtobacterium sp. MCBD17_035 TaxID=2175673 RepID=UPI0024E02687|nr:hypothetical protein [Curtobacterium sp. MCBD17_035]WIB66190.1 hypothetical protein DEI93_09290 [Curtobacterium sp. MCBD17_035]